VSGSGNPEVDRLLNRLELEQQAPDSFSHPNTSRWRGGGRLFGGQVASQALRAAGLTVASSLHVHSLHSYFLRPGKVGVPITLGVDRIRDGRSFATRRVVAVQDEEPIFELSASFHVEEPGFDVQIPLPPEAPEPEALPASPVGKDHPHHRPFDLREFGPLPGSHRSTWARVAGRLPDDPAIHACVLTYLSDMGPVGAARRAGPTEVPTMRASLDHVLWFHRPVRADDWLLYDLEAVSLSGARGLVRGLVHGRDGRLAMTVGQEALLRPLA
jgi:acyl-CoA thioesterase-2